MTVKTLTRACGVGLALCGATALADERAYDFEGFDGIRVEGVYEVVVAVGPDYAVTLSGPERALEGAEVALVGDQLVLRTKDGQREISWSGRKKDAVTATISLPSLSAVSMLGVGSLEVEGIDADGFEATLEGVGNLELAGTCADLTASVEGVGAIEARDLECERVDVSVQGIGSAEVYAAQRVDARVEGMGSIDVWGEPGEVARSKNFLSSVDIR